MGYTDFCKACSISVRLPIERIKDMVDEIVKSGNFNLVSEATYNFRLEQCSGCKYLEYGTTCMQCGCFVQVRALFAEKDCPLPMNSRWR